MLRLLSLALALGWQLPAQQTYVGRFDAYVGYAYLNSPHINLPEHGVHTQAGIRALTWLSLGVDYSRTTGDLDLKPDMLLTDLQQRLGAQIRQLIAAGVIPSTYQLRVPAASTTHSLAAGPQVAIRHFKEVTFFIRPSCGYIYEKAIPNPPDAVSTAIVKQLAPSGEKTNWTPFYGVGGGVDLNITKHFGLRVQADLVRDHLFNDLLKDARNTVRFSIGPAVQWGKNVVH